MITTLKERKFLKIKSLEELEELIETEEFMLDKYFKKLVKELDIENIYYEKRYVPYEYKLYVYWFDGIYAQKIDTSINEGFRVNLKFYYKFQDLKALFVKVVNSHFLTSNSCLFAQYIL